MDAQKKYPPYEKVNRELVCENDKVFRKQYYSPKDLRMEIVNGEKSHYLVIDSVSDPGFRQKRIKVGPEAYLEKDLIYCLKNGKFPQEVVDEYEKTKSQEKKDIIQNIKLLEEDQISEKSLVESIGGKHNLSSKPVDGYMPDGSPIEVKMTDRPIGIEVLDKFHRFCQDSPHKTGYIICYGVRDTLVKHLWHFQEMYGIKIHIILIKDMIHSPANQTK